MELDNMYKKYTDLSNKYFWTYDDLYKRYKKRTFLIVLGTSGSGKTTLSQLLHKKILNSIYISYDLFFKDYKDNISDSFIQLINSLSKTDCDIILDGLYGIKIHIACNLIESFNYDVHVIKKEVSQRKIIDNIISRIDTIKCNGEEDIKKYLKNYETKITDIEYFKRKVKEKFDIDFT